MATEQEVYQMTLQIQGAEKAADLKSAIALAEQKIAALYQTMKGQPAQFQQAIKQTSADLIDLKQKLEAAEKAAAGLQGASRNGGRALLEFSRAFEDAQYGIAGVLNNIPGLVQALGAGAGLVGAISSVVVAAALLYHNWDLVLSIFGSSKVLTEAQEMKKLGENTKKTADEEERLQKLKNRDKHDQAQHGEVKNATELGKNIDEAIKEAPVKKIDEDIKVIYSDELKAKVDPGKLKARDEAQKSYEGANTLFNSGQMTADQVGGFRGALDKAQKAVDAEIDEAVRAKRLDLTAVDKNGQASNLASFIDELQRRNLMGTGDIKKLQKAGRDPQQVKEDEDDAAAEQHAQEFSNSHQAKLDKFQKDGAQQRVDDEEQAAWDELQESSKDVHAHFDDRRDADKKDVDQAKKRSTIASKRINNDIERDPQADSKLQMEYLQNLMGGMSSEQSNKSIQKRLKESFMDLDIDLSDEDASKMARKRVDEAGRSIGNEAFDSGGNRGFEHVGAAELTRQVQEGYGTKDDLQKTANEYLKQLLDEVKKDPVALANLQATFS